MWRYIIQIGKQPLPQPLAKNVEVLTKIFGARGMAQAWRNDTVHGNKDLDGAAWAQIRAFVIRDQVFACVSSVSREFVRLQRRHSELLQRKQSSDALTGADQLELKELESFLTTSGKK